MRALFDLSALIALFDDQHVENRRAHHWFAANRTNGWATCPLTQNGFVRIISQSSYRSPISLREAIEHLQEATETEGHEFWADDISLLNESLFNRSHILGPKQLTDIYLLALAVEHGGRLVTLDQGISHHAVRDARPHHLVLM